MEKLKVKILAAQSDLEELKENVQDLEEYIEEVISLLEEQPPPTEDDIESPLWSVYNSLDATISILDNIREALS